MNPRVLQLIKQLPIDLGQGWYRHTTKAKLIAFSEVPEGHGRAALDFGCGDGYWSERLRRRGWHVTSTNFHDDRCPWALMVSAEDQLPFPTHAFDLVWLAEVIEHVESLDAFLGEVRRTLTPRGRLIATTPNSAFWLYRLLALWQITPRDVQNPDHKQFFSLADIRRRFPKAELSGFFPYALIKVRIRHGLGLLSPTFVVVEDQRTRTP